MALESLTFKEIKARPVICKLTRPAVARIGAMTHLPIILIDLFTEEGVVGRSYLKPYLPKAMKYLIPALLDFGEMLKGRRVSPVDLYETARKSLHFVGYQGLSMIAVAGLDMAAWDALAKAADVPLCVLLGGSVGPVKAYNSNGLWLQSPESAAAEAVELLDERGGGFRAMKLRLGRADPRDDLAAIGDDIDLMVDFNQALDVPEAIRRVRRLTEFDLHWIEEPVKAEDLAGHAQVRAATGATIQTGENWWFPAGMAAAISAGASDHAMPDLMKIGGVTGWLSAAGLAHAAGLPVSSHIFAEASAHVMALTPTAHLVEWLDLAGSVLAEPLQVVEGQITPRGPGLGLDWDDKAVARFAA